MSGHRSQPRRLGDMEQSRQCADLTRANCRAAVAAFRRAAELNPVAAPTRLNLARALRRSRASCEEAEVSSFGRWRPISRAMPSRSIDLYHVLRERGRDEATPSEVLEQAHRKGSPDNVDCCLSLAASSCRNLEFDKGGANLPRGDRAAIRRTETHFSAWPWCWSTTVRSDLAELAGAG